MRQHGGVHRVQVAGRINRDSFAPRSLGHEMKSRTFRERCAFL